MASIEDIHCMPADDAVPHEADDDCLCQPKAFLHLRPDSTGVWIMIHHSLDGREGNRPDPEFDPLQF